MSKLFSLFALSLAARLGLAAPCCGGNTSIPSLIAADHAAQFSATSSYNRVMAEANVAGKMKDRAAGDDESAWGLRLDGAFLLSDRWQAGISVPYLTRSHSRNGYSETASGFSDTTVNIGYEFLPEWEYSAWKPRGWIYLAQTFPTGNPVSQATGIYRVDSRGRGFHATGAGFLLTKIVDAWDFSFSGELHRAYDRHFDNGLTLRPGWGYSASLATGISPGMGALRFGIALSPSHEDGVRQSGLVTGRGADIVTWTTTLSIGYLLTEDLTLTANYLDQSWLGGANNTALNRGFSVFLQKRWDR